MRTNQSIYNTEHMEITLLLSKICIFMSLQSLCKDILFPIWRISHSSKDSMWKMLPLTAFYSFRLMTSINKHVSQKFRCHLDSFQFLLQPEPQRILKIVFQAFFPFTPATSQQDVSTSSVSFFNQIHIYKKSMQVVTWLKIIFTRHLNSIQLHLQPESQQFIEFIF